MRKIYANGCSMTYGAELNREETHVPVEALTPKQNAYRLRHSWPGVVHQLVGPERQLLNGAIGGAANERIVRTTINDVLRYNLGPKDLVLIGWTETERFEYVKGKTWVQQTVNVRPDWYDEIQFVDDWARLMMGNTDMMWERFLVQVLTVQAFLNERHIPWLMFNALPPVTIDSFPKIPKHLDHLKAAVNAHRWLTTMDDMHQCMFNQIKHLPQAKYLHPLEEGHQLWGEIVYAQIRDRLPYAIQA